VAYSLAAAPAGATIDPVAGIIQWLADTNFTGTSQLFTVIATEDGWSTNLAGEADAFIRNGTPTTSYGTNDTLEVKLGSASTTRESYLRFAIPALRGNLRKATLQLTPVATFSPGTHAVAAALSNGWDELTLNWNNRPASGPAVDFWQPQMGVTSSADVTAAALAATNGLVSLRVHATNATGDGLVQYGSREGDANLAPRLRVVTTNGIALTATQSFWVTVVGPPVLQPVSNQSISLGDTLVLTNVAYDPNPPPQRLFFSLATAPTNAVINTTNGVVDWTPATAQAGTSNLFTVVVSQAGWLTNLAPVADAYVRNGTPTGNYGTNDTLEVKLGSASTTREAYLRFALNGLNGQLAGAELQLAALAAFSPGTHAVALVTNDVWGELAVNWNNRPDSGLPSLAAWNPVAGSVAVADVTAVVAQELASDGLLSLRLYATNATGDGLVTYAAREAAGNQMPALMIATTNLYSLSSTQSFWVTVPAISEPPVLNLVAATATNLTLSISAAPGTLCELMLSTNLTAWAVIFTTNAPAVPFLWTDPNPAAASPRFYRVRMGL
jgi:hypothetical protein